MKKIERGVPHMLAFRRRCLRYSKVYCDVRKSLLLAWNQNRHIMYYKFYIPYTNSKISIGLLYILPHFIWWHRLNHCASLVRNLVTLILVRSLVKRNIPYVNHFGTIMVYELQAPQIPEPFHFHPGKQHQKFLVEVWKKDVSIKN